VRQVFEAQKKMLSKKGILALSISIAMLSFFTLYYYSNNRYVDFRVDRNMSFHAGTVTNIPIRITNKTRNTISNDEAYYLSGHLFSLSDNSNLELKRMNIALEPHKPIDTSLRINIPSIEGTYLLSIDIVKEGEYWFKDRGNRPANIKITVQE